MPEFYNREELEARIKVLERENDLLAERAEDTLMLGIISESIAQAESVTGMLEVALERISMLKNIPMVACCSLEGNMATVRSAYLSFCHDDWVGHQFQLPPLDHGTPLFIGADNPHIHVMHGSEIDFTPDRLLLIHFSTFAVDHGVYLFADCGNGDERLQGFCPILQRITDLLTLSMDHHEVLHSYKALNADLDLQVETQTASLAKSEKEYRGIVDHIQDCLYRADAQGTLVFSSPSIQTLMCCEPDEIIGDKLTDYYVDPNGRHEFMQRLMNAPDGKVAGYEAQVRRKDGKVIWVSTNAHFIYDDAGHVQGVEGTLRDVTAVKKIEESLRKLSQAVEQAGDAILLLDYTGVIEYVNPKFSEMTGYSLEEAVGKTLALLKSSLQDAGFYAEMWQTVKEGKQWENRLIDRRKDGSLYPAVMSISPIVNDQGGITHYVAIQRDMSAIEAMEEQFHQAQKMEAMGTLVGGIAHDFNNILAAIVGSVYLAKKNLKVQESRDLDTIDEQATRAADMVKKLLAFARKDVHRLETMVLNDMISSSAEVLRLSATENIQIIFDLCEEPITIEGDATQLQQVLFNLINNARDAVEGKATPVITLSLRPFTSDAAFRTQHPNVSGRHFARLSIADNGVGISEEDMPQIFEPFYSRKQANKGTGLGLAMIHGTVASHHGVIEVESTVGQGSRFEIFLPISESVLSTSQEASEHIICKGEGQTVLVVDDEPMLRIVHEEVLAQLDYQVLTATDGLHAVELFEENRQHIDLILMDIVMPRMGGVDAARKIREVAPDIPIIFVTGYDKSQVLDGKLHQMDHCLVMTKPFNVDELSQSIKQLM
ncbi:MAG: PAS domain S-box protein [Mariprofundaceae bacterium]